jgi:glutamate-1-semialdehyde 2,1-aminomutase
VRAPHCNSYTKDIEETMDAGIMRYVSLEHLRAAHDFELTVSVHMVKQRALSDEENLRDIRMICEDFPNLKLVLCHSARGFNMHHVIESIDKLVDLQNLYFDTGAVTEAGATNALIRAFGPQKVMYGSDWPVAESRGKCITLGDSFIWLTPDNVDLFARYAEGDIVSPALVGFETLRALKQACDETGAKNGSVFSSVLSFHYVCPEPVCPGKSSLFMLKCH